MKPDSLLEQKTPRWRRILLFAPRNERVQVERVIVFPPTSYEKENITNIYLKRRDGWRIEESLVEHCNN